MVLSIYTHISNAIANSKCSMVVNLLKLDGGTAQGFLIINVLDMCLFSLHYFLLTILFLLPQSQKLHSAPKEVKTLRHTMFSETVDFD